jgi:ABC-type uncharacterized transport system substrate-binding protein
MVGVSESPPTKQATELYRELAQQVDGQIAELSSLERKELKAFNKDAKRAGLDPVRS